MQRSWRGKGKPRKKNKPWKNKGENWSSENEDALYKKMERQKQHRRKEIMDEIEELEEADLMEEAITNESD